MAPTATQASEFDTHAAPFIEASEPVYALIGAVIIGQDRDGSPAYYLTVGEGLARPFDLVLLPAMEFFEKPRTESQVRAWLTLLGETTALLDQLLANQLLVKIDTTTPLSALESLSGLTVIAQSLPDASQTQIDGTVWALPFGGGPAYIVGAELASALWWPDRTAELSTMVSSIATAQGDGLDIAARRVLTEIPALLEFGLARLEWLNGPRG
ncbi:hypothetical protein [Agrococcus jenensis]|uniref:Uncharacterized protein n=1 Tax=Agrococcus jenensis TaxID=46353 RepID=A0A3N2AQM1_9MICO|nr:hypothetical protein [Agrococcus jenensis]ROR65334.1 hypothetical protein EDD26_0700 [Agrococcus jenensis]